MHRAPIVLTATVAGVAAVLSFHPHKAAVPAPAAASAPSSSSSSGTRTAIGEAIDTRYGPAQVRVTVADGKITSIEAVQLQANDPHSQQISSYAAPILRQEALTAQTAAVDTVSGATYTSASYEASLQSALDKLGFEAADGSRASADVPS